MYIRLENPWTTATALVGRATRGVAYAYALVDMTEAVQCARQGDGCGAAARVGSVSGRLAGATLGVSLGMLAGSVVATPTVGGTVGALAGGTLGSEWGEAVGRGAGVTVWNGIAAVTAAPPGAGAED
ncbi:MAG: hypothetical protein GVY12_14640 [Bacteroidetes bacterium]|jgi:hypothetical protein|nr:hypothetical protein [Bacteroidota bacterium]